MSDSLETLWTVAWQAPLSMGFSREEYWFSSVQSHPTLCDPVDCSTPGFPVHHQLPEPTQTHVHWVSDATQPSHPLSPPLLSPSVFPSIRIFSSESALCIRWPKYWSFSSNISPTNEYSGLISFRMDWFDLLAFQRDSQESSPTPQFKSLSSSVLSLRYGLTLTSIHDYWKNHSFDWMDLAGKVMSLLLNMLYAAAAAKSLQSSLTLCDPTDSSPPGSPVPGVVQAKSLEWVAMSFS